MNAAVQLELNVPDDPVGRMVAVLLQSEAWDRPSAEAFARRVVPKLRTPCDCGGRGDRSCRLSAGDPRHGTRNGYKHQGCACPHCTRATARYIADLRPRRSA